MKSRIISILLLLVVVIGFSGVASAASHQELVKEAYDEQVLVTPEVPAYDEPVFSHWLVDGEYTVFHPAVLISEEIPAWDEVISEAIPAWNELITPEIPAWNESIEADHNGWTLNAAKQVQQKKHNLPINAQFYNLGTIKNGYKVVDDVGCGVNKIWIPVFNIIEHPAVPAVYEFHPEVPAVIVHHDLIPAVYEPAYYEQVPYFDNGPYYGGSPETGISGEDVSTWADWIYSNGPNVTGGWGSWTPYYTLIHHDAIPAVFDIIHHPAEYITVEDPVEPIVKPPVKEVPKVDEPVSIDIPVTGGSFNFLILALLAVLVGMFAAYKLRE